MTNIKIGAASPGRNGNKIRLIDAVLRLAIHDYGDNVAGVALWIAIVASRDEGD